MGIVFMREKNDGIRFPKSLDQMDEKLKEAHALPFAPRLLFCGSEVRALQQSLLFESASLQWLITWWRTLSGSTKIDLFEQGDPLQSLKKISDTLAGAILGFLPEQAIEEVSKQTLAKYRDAFLKQQFNWPDLDLRDRAVLICVDTMPVKVGLSTLLYPDLETRNVANREIFGTVTDKLISSVTRESNIRGAITSHRDRLTTILHELFKNTHDHARTAIDKTPLDLSIRGLYARYYPADVLKTKLFSDEIELTDLNQVELFTRHFFEAAKPRHEGLRPKAPMEFLGMLEISIFDSGPGFAATYLKEHFQNASVQEQFDAVLGCFRTGRSSTNDESRGYGLWKVLRDLKEMKGLIRVRTNKVNVYRDFARFPDSWMNRSEIVAPEERLLDWKRGLTSKIDEGYPDVQGAHLSILIPLGDGL